MYRNIFILYDNLMYNKFIDHYSSGGDVKLPTEYMLLDGCSLSTDDLVQLGKNMYKIKVTKHLIFYTKSWIINYLNIVLKHPNLSNNFFIVDQRRRREGS